MNFKEEINKLMSKDNIEEYKYISIWIPISWPDPRRYATSNDLSDLINRTKGYIKDQQWYICDIKTGEVVCQRHKVCKRCYFCGI